MSRPSKVVKLSIERFSHRIATPAIPLQCLREYSLSSNGRTSLHTEYIPLSQSTPNETHPLSAVLLQKTLQMITGMSYLLMLLERMSQKNCHTRNANAQQLYVSIPLNYILEG